MSRFAKGYFTKDLPMSSIAIAVGKKTNRMNVELIDVIFSYLGSLLLIRRGCWIESKSNYYLLIMSLPLLEYLALIKLAFIFILACTPMVSVKNHRFGLRLFSSRRLE